MIKKTHPSLLILTVSILTLAVAVCAAGQSIGVSLTQNGCSNCLRKFVIPDCDLRCQLSLTADLQNNTDEALLIEVILSLTMPKDVGCNNGDDVQVAEYLVPALGAVHIDFSHVLAGMVVGADSKVKARVLQSESGQYDGDTASAKIDVSTAWRMCPKPLPR